MDYIAQFLQQMGEQLRLPVTFVVIEFVGTVAFAISGIRLASAKNFDWFGAYIVGMATAIGGGTIRDIMLGLSPFWMTNTLYLWCCAFAMVCVAIMRRYLVRRKDTLLFIFDTIGLALFNLIGIEKTLNMGFPVWCAIIMGCITGAGGGVLRDVFINEIPLIFRKEIYALACILGGVVYVFGLDIGLNTEATAALSCIIVIAIRCLAEIYHWHLPVMKAAD
mgnify:FL=1